MTASYPHNLNAIYAKYAKEAEPALRPAPTKADSGKNQSWLDSLTRALVGNALISGSLLLPDRLQLTDKIAPFAGKDFTRVLSAHFPGYPMDRTLTNAKLKHYIKYIPNPSEYAAILKRQQQLLRRARRLEPKINFADNPRRAASHNSFNNKIYATTERPDVLAHEMGHARNDRTVRRLFGAKGPLHYAKHVRAYNTPLLAARIAAPFMLGSDNENVRAAAPWVMAASSLPVLTGEALASIRGMRNYYRRLGGRRPLRAAGSLGRAFGTYAVETALPALAAYLANKMNNAALASDNEKLRSVYQRLALAGGGAALYRNIKSEQARIKKIKKNLPTI